MGLRELFGFPSKKPAQVTAVVPAPVARVEEDNALAQPPVEENPQKPRITFARIARRLKGFILGYPKDRVREGWAEPEYDLAEVDRAENTESLLKMSINKYTEKIMNCGWYLRSQNPSTRAYIRRRLTEFGLATGIPWEVTFEEIVRNVVKYNNGFMWLRRNPEFSSGQPIKMYGKRLDPIAGVFAIDPTSMKPRVDKYNNVTGWKQEVDVFGATTTISDAHTKKEYSRLDIVHIYRNRTTGFVFGTPDYIPVFDDMRDLRMTEDHANMLIHAHAFPLYHIVVGTEDNPAGQMADGTDEIDWVISQYEAMTAEGAFVTSERVKINVVGAENEALDLKNYIDNYRNRVQYGVYLSDIDVGRGDSANRATARQLSYGFQERCKSIQRAIEDFITHQFFNQLLLEGGYDLIPENQVELKFHEIDIHTQMEVSNHAMALYQGHMMTRTEARLAAGLRPLEPKHEKDMFWEQIEKKATLMKAVDEPYSSAAKNATKNKNQPTNQSGTKMAKTPAKNDYLQLAVEECLQNEDPTTLELDSLAHKLSLIITQASIMEINAGMDEFLENAFVGKSVMARFRGLVRDKLDMEMDRIRPYFAEADTVLAKAVVLDAIRDDVRELTDTWPLVAREYGRYRGYMHTHAGTAPEGIEPTYRSLLGAARADS